MGIKIAVAGEIRAGKDTVAEYFQTKVKHMEKIYFAQGIKEIIKNYFPEAMKDSLKPRKHYQDIGQYMRKVNPDVWVNNLERDYKFLQEYHGIENFICTDLRQPNEYQWLKENGFQVIKVEAEPELRIQRIEASGDAFDRQELIHPVEMEIRNLPYDYLITNNTTLEDLYEQADYVLAEVFAEGGD